MKIDNNILEKILVDSKKIPEKTFQAAKQEAKDFDKDIVDVLIFKGLITEEELGKLVAAHLDVSYADIRNSIIPYEILQVIPEKVAHSYRIIPFQVDDNELHLAMEDPTNFEAIEFTKRKTGLKIIPYYIMPDDLTKTLA